MVFLIASLRNDPNDMKVVVDDDDDDDDDQESFQKFLYIWWSMTIQTCSNMIKHDQTWSNMIKHEFLKNS